MSRSSFLVLAVAASLWPFATAHEVAAQETINLTFPLAMNRALLIESQLTIDADINILSGSFDWSDDVIMREEFVIIDEHKEYRAGGKQQKAMRHYVRHKASYNGEVSDSALNGVRANYTLGKDDEGWSIKLEDDRALTGRLFDVLQASASTLSLWSSFPESARVGLVSKVDVSRLAPFFFGDTVKAEGNANLVLETYDATTRAARLAGEAVLRATEIVDDTEVVTEMKGRLVIGLSVSEQRITEIDFDGTIGYTGDGKIEVSGGGTAKFQLTTTIDAKKVAQQRKQKPKFRDRKIRAPRLGVGLILPSHWTVFRGNGDDLQFVRTLDFDKGEATIDLKYLKGDASYQPGLFFDQLYTALKREYPGLIYEKTPNPLGGDVGRVYYVPASDDVQNGDLVQVEVYPFRGRFLMFRLYGPAPAYRAAHKEFLKAKASIGALNPKRKR
ncbi:MAG: hypothetical protein AB7O52_08245 [Planctomycetota bacterium]